MNPEYHRQLEAEISRELGRLPDLAAPASLVSRVRAAIEQRSAAPWYRRAWQTWSPPLQSASLLALLALFAGLCFAGWKLSHAGMTGLAAGRAGDWYSGLATIVNTLEVLANAVMLLVRNIGPGFLIAGLLAVGLAYALFAGLGTLYLQLGLAKR